MSDIFNESYSSHKTRWFVANIIARHLKITLKKYYTEFRVLNWEYICLIRLNTTEDETKQEKKQQQAGEKKKMVKK